MILKLKISKYLIINIFLCILDLLNHYLSLFGVGYNFYKNFSTHYTLLFYLTPSLKRDFKSYSVEQPIYNLIFYAISWQFIK